MAELVKNILQRRRSGFLLHATSLPSPYGIGDLGPGAYAFIDFLVQAGQSYWQILPLTPTSMGLCNSPYSSYSAFAGNPLLISPELLIEEGFIRQEESQPLENLTPGKIDYEAVTQFKTALLFKSFVRKRYEVEESADFQKFCADNAFWLDSYSAYVALKERFGQSCWNKWPEPVRTFTPELMNDLSELSDQILREKFFQYLFFKQWQDLKEYANDRDISIIGDLPIYVNYDSADVWAHPNYFQLDEQNEMVFVAGVPPDYFSETGQLWGNPVYDWDALKTDGYSFWLKRLKQNLAMYDVVRIDHFRGLVQYWRVPRGEKTALNGHWADVPTRNFLDTIQQEFPEMPIIAEDLGIITDDVKEIILDYNLPGMKILMFAFGDDVQNPYLPQNYSENCIVYTGTHDNNTVKGWFQRDVTEGEMDNMKGFLNIDLNPDTIVPQFIEQAMNSKANTVIIPLQDALGIGEEGRMNKPSTTKNNWAWRCQREHLSFALAHRFRRLTETAGRV